LLIANYETLLDDKVLEVLVKKKLQCVMCDEIHYAKTHTAERSKALYKLNDAVIKIGATATPITKDPRDIYGIYKFIKPDLLGKVGNFQKRYVNYAGFGRINGFKNTEELSDIISNNIFVKTKKEVAGQLPQLQVSQIYIDLTPEQIYKHDEMMAELDDLNKKDFQIRSQCKSEAEAMLNAELQQINGKIMALQTFAQELTDSPLLLLTSESDYSKSHAEGLDMNKNPKLDMCLELIEQILEAEEKVCIFSKFERMQSILTEAINKKFNKKNNDIKIAYINGSLSSEQRYEEAYTKFRDTNDYKILLCSDAGAEGLNLSKCKYLIEYDLATSYAIQTQRQGRVERADSIHKQAFVFQLIGKNVWDEIQEKIIAKKEGFDSNIIKSLAKN
jgi:superfamily II DNA or RNA helicase